MWSGRLYLGLLSVSGAAAFAPEDEVTEPIPLGYIIEYERVSHYHMSADKEFGD